VADIKKEVLDFNLNGTDWSNLYHVDYSGGTGGERLAEAIATKVNAGDFLVEYNHGINHENINYGIKDSFFNQYTQPTVYTHASPFLLYQGSIDEHKMHEVASNLKLLRYYRPEIELLGLPEPINPAKLPTEYEKELAIKVHRDHANLILRTHKFPRHWEVLDGIKSIYMYPSRQTHIITLRMFLRRWLNQKDLEQERIHSLLGDEMYKWFTEKFKSDDGYYAWQIELALKNIDNFYNGKDFRTDWEYFVDKWIVDHPNHLETDWFVRDLDKFDRRKKLIDPYDWCFGETNDVFVHIRNILGLDLMSPELERWQIKNKNEIENQGISIEEEDPLVCREFIINYFHNKGLKVGGLK